MGRTLLAPEAKWELSGTRDVWGALGQQAQPNAHSSQDGGLLPLLPSSRRRRRESTEEQQRLKEFLALYGFEDVLLGFNRPFCG